MATQMQLQLQDGEVPEVRVIHFPAGEFCRAFHTIHITNGSDDLVIFTRTEEDLEALRLNLAQAFENIEQPQEGQS